MENIFDALLTLPLFNGMSRPRLLDIAGRIRLRFVKLRPGEIVLRQGEDAENLVFMISGRVKISVVDEKSLIKVEQYIEDNCLLSADKLFGRKTYYSGTIIAEADSSFLFIDKEEVLKLVETDNIFCINYLNLLSAKAQKGGMYMLMGRKLTLPFRLRTLVELITINHAKEIMLTISHRSSFFEFLDCSRYDYVNLLQHLSRDCEIRFTEHQISIADRKQFLIALESFF